MIEFSLSLFVNQPYSNFLKVICMNDFVQKHLGFPPNFIMFEIIIFTRNVAGFVFLPFYIFRLIIESIWLCIFTF